MHVDRIDGKPVEKPPQKHCRRDGHKRHIQPDPPVIKAGYQKVNAHKCEHHGKSHIPAAGSPERFFPISREEKGNAVYNKKKNHKNIRQGNRQLFFFFTTILFPHERQIPQRDKRYHNPSRDKHHLSKKPVFIRCNLDISLRRIKHIQYHKNKQENINPRITQYLRQIYPCAASSFFFFT